MTAQNRHFTVLTVFFMAWIPVFGQQADSSAETCLRKAEAYHRAYEFSKAEEMYGKALELITDETLRPAVMDRMLQCRNGENLLQYIVRPEAVASRTVSIKDFYLYLNDLEDRSWIPIPNPFIRPEEGKGHHFYTAMYFPDGKQSVIYSAPDGKGAWNLYTSSRKDSTSWSVPELLSSNIISGHNEIFPILSRDGRTLYFASDGLPGMGGYDLFYSRWNEDTEEWDVPENMGFPYSSTGNDLMYLNSNDGQYSIIVSDRETGGTDSVKIYVAGYIATPVKTPLGEDESPQAVASFAGDRQGSGRQPASAQEQTSVPDARMEDYSKLMHGLRNLQEEHRERLDKIEESRRIYENASEKDREFLAGIIRNVEKEALQIRRQMDSISAQVRQIEIQFLAEGIIPTVREDKPARERFRQPQSAEYVFRHRTMGKIPYIIVETPEPEFDYTFRILGRNEGQFAEDNTLPAGIVYQIQFSVLTRHADVRDIRGMTPVFVTRMKSGKYLHTVGVFRTYSDASSNLGRVRRNGFPEAFIIAYNNGKSISVKNARALENERILQNGTTSSRTPSSDRGDMSYQVVIDGCGPTLPASVIDTIRETCRKDITKSGSDGETVFAVGPFPERSEAEKLLRVLQDLNVGNISIESIKL